jgi:hypothetical protein
MASKFVRRVGAIVLALTLAVEGSISSAGETVVVNGISYFADPDSVSIIAATPEMLSSASPKDGDLVPLTVMDDPSSSFTTSAFRSIVGNYSAADDVFNPGFLQGKLCLAT